MKDLFNLIGLSRQALWKYNKREAYKRELIAHTIVMIKKIRKRHKRMSCRAIHAVASIQPMVGRDRFEAIGLENGYRLKRRRNKRKTTWGQTIEVYPNLIEGKTLNGINQVWQSDIFYHNENGKEYYGITIIDVYSRRLVALHLSRSMRAEENVKAFITAIKSRPQQKVKGCIFHSDRGSQYISDLQKKMLNEYGMKKSMCKIPQENAYAERVQETIQHYYLCDVTLEGKSLNKVCNEIMRKYNYERPHSELGMRSPVAFEKYVEKMSKRARPKTLIFKWDHHLSTKT